MSLSTVCSRRGLRSGSHRTPWTVSMRSLGRPSVHAGSRTAAAARRQARISLHTVQSNRRLITANYRLRNDSPETHHASLLDAVPAADLAVFKRAEAAWQRLCTSGAATPTTVVTRHRGAAPQGHVTDHYDVVVLGGTLGIISATALLYKSQQQQQQQHLRVAVVERGVLQGRQQEWNITHSDLQTLVDYGVLSSSEVADVVMTRFTAGVRVGVEGRTELRFNDVMDCGVSPEKLIDIVKRRFLALGGTILEHTAFEHLDVYDDTALLTLAQQQQQQQQQQHSSSAAAGAGGRSATFGPAAAAAAAESGSKVLSAGIVLDALGGFSPISAQARNGQMPESAMLLVGSCVDVPQQQQQQQQGRAAAADVLWGMTPIDKKTCLQYWFEKFPAAAGAAATTYMFAFTDPAPANKDVMQQMMETYLDTLPQYLDISASELTFQRGVFGFVPCYPDRVLPITDRLLPIGDSAGNRSSLSLAGFCALVRHLPRLTDGLMEALAAGAMSQQELSLLQPWCPGVTASSAMQRTMAVYSNQHDTITNTNSTSAAAAAASSSSSVLTPGREVLDVMGSSLAAMAEAVGEVGMRPFLADRLQWGALAAGMAQQIKTGLPQLIAYSQFLGDTRGAPRLAIGLAGLGMYTMMHNIATILTGPFHEALLARSPRLLYRWHRYVDAWEYGSGSDWKDVAAAAAATAASSSSSSSSQASNKLTAKTPFHSVATYEDSLLTYEGAESGDVPLCPSNLPLCADAMHSVDATDIIDWAESPNTGLSSKRNIAAAAAAGAIGSSRGLKPLQQQQQHIGWGTSSKCKAIFAPRISQSGRSGVPAVAAAAGHSSSSSSSNDRRKLEQLLLKYVDTSHVNVNRRKQRTVDPLDEVVSISGPPSNGSSMDHDTSSSSSSAYNSADPVWLLYPQIDPTQTVDEYDIIDWSDVPNNGWGSSSSSSSGKASCIVGGGCRSGSSGMASSSSSSKGTAVRWGSSKCHSVFAAGHGYSSSSSRMRCLAAAAAGGDSAGSGPYHSVDTHEDSLQGYEGADAADQGLCPSDTPLCDDPAAAAAAAGASLDSAEIIDWSADSKTSTSSSSSSGSADKPAAAAAAVKSDASSSKAVKKAPRPYMNIVNGRWVPPSKAEAERMMQGHTHMGPDEGV